MVMDTIQIRLGHGLVERIDDLVETKLYGSRSEVIRDSVRRLVLDKMAGIISDKKNSVKEVKNIRGKLSKDIKNFKDLEKINNLA